MNAIQKRWRQFEIRLQKSTRVQNALQSVFSAYVNFAFRTTRWEKIGFEPFEADIARGVPRVLCCWHAQLAFATYIRDWTDHPLTVMASQHADAQILKRNLRERGVGIIDLATTGDNTSALREAVRVLRAGHSLGVTVDGPMGPAREAKPGALVIAGLTGIQATPCGVAVSRYFRLRTWDRFIVPLPFARGVMAVGDGFVPPRRMNDAETRAATDRMAALIDALAARCEARLKSR